MEIYAKLDAREEKENGLRFSEYMEQSIRHKANPFPEPEEKLLIGSGA